MTEESLNKPVKFPRTTKTKYVLPSYYELKSFKFDLPRLRAEVTALEGKFKNVVESNRELCSNNHELVQSVYDHYEQVSLTTIESSAPLPTPEQCVSLGQSAGSDRQLSKHSKYRLKISRRTDLPELDERNYNTPTDDYRDSYIRECVETIGEQVLRVRLVKLKAGQTVDWHIDYDPSYATRIILPIFTNSDVVNRTKRRGQVESIHLPANGTPWFLNTGFSHCVENNGNADRIVLMFSLDAPTLLHRIQSEWQTWETT